MAREYYIKNDQSRFAVAYGKHAVHGVVVHDETKAVGSDLQVTFRRGLGIGEWDACEQLFYKENESAHKISTSNFIFHPGIDADASDTFFPGEPGHPGIAYDSIRLPVGLAQDNKPENAVGIYRCLKIADYDANGNEIGYGYSANPARVAADIIKRTRPRILNRIDWGAWIEWRDWCATLISATIDEVVVTIPRFETHIFLVPPFSLEAALDRICQITCSDWQWRNGMIRFMAPIDRPSEFTFDLDNVTPNDFKFLPVDSKSRPNMVRVFYRDLRHPYLKDADPVEVRRQVLLDADGGIENPLEINIGTAEQSEAERVAEFWAKIRCDNPKVATLISGWTGYPIVPGDMVEITHDVPDYTDVDYKVMEKEEDEDNGTGYDFKLQAFPLNAYSDLDHTPAQTPVVPEVPNPFAAPDPPTINISELSQESDTGVLQKHVEAKIDFPDSVFERYTKLWLVRPDAEEPELLTEMRPGTNSTAIVRATDFLEGDHLFKAISYNQFGMASDEVEVPFTIAKTDLEVDGLNAVSGLNRSFLGLGESGQRTERDTGIVAVGNITASIFSQTAVEGGATIDVRISVLVADGATHNNADTVSAVECDVFNQFGELIVDNVPQPMTLKAALLPVQHTRKYADATEGQAYYRIRVYNNFGWSGHIYLQGTSVTTSAPSAKDRANCPLELSANPISDTQLQLSYQYSGNVNLYRRSVGESVWVKHNATAITSSPNIQANFAEYAEYDLQLRSTTASANRSNIVRVRTKPQGAAAPARPSPLSPSGSVNASNPQTQLDFSCVSAANVETEVYVNGALADTKPAVAAGGPITHSITGLAASTSRSVKFRHKWGTADYSDFTTEITRTTDATPSTANKPFNLFGEFTKEVLGEGFINLTWQNDGGDGAFTIQRKLGVGGTVSTLTSSHTAPLTSYTDIVFQSPSGFTYYYRIKDNDIGAGEAAYTTWEEVLIPPFDLHKGGEPPIE